MPAPNQTSTEHHYRLSAAEVTNITRRVNPPGP